MAIQATSEEQLRMRRRARRRLLGAVTLLLMAAIFLPMLLDKEPRPLDRDIEIRIPAQTGAPLVSAPPVMSAAPSAPAAAPLQPALPADKSATPPSAPDADQAEIATPQPKPRLAEPDTTPKAASPQPEKIPLKTEPPHTPDAAALEKSTQPTNFVVQLGAFSSAENVRQLRERLSAAGIRTYTESLPNGATRVRAGPFKTRAQADRTQASIAMLGMQAKVIAMDN